MKEFLSSQFSLLMFSPANFHAESIEFPIVVFIVSLFLFWLVLRIPFERNNLKKYQGIPSEQARSVKELKLINPRWDFPKVANHGIEGVCLIEENFLYDSKTRSLNALKDFSFHFSTS